MSIGETVKKIRVAAGMTQVEFAAAIGCLQAYVSKIEVGNREPSTAFLKRIMQFAKSKKIKFSAEDLLS